MPARRRPAAHGGTLALSIAGAEANVAIGLARLGHRARWAGVVGQDELGALVLRTLRAEGVDVSTVRESGDRPTGLMIQESRIADITRVHYYRAGSAGSTLSPADATAALTPAPRLLHVTGITPRSATPRARPSSRPYARRAPRAPRSSWTSTTARGCGTPRRPRRSLPACCRTWTC
ncbi:PfkB family carbohydrate kinase [Thermocatellispora tengchongensis]|uniref:PfkB family carbohydrate kinase n=1 Tax=Thermocatellispora tengchongensis TaxID=1073253 RepID=UPI0036414257